MIPLYCDLCGKDLGLTNCDSGMPHRAFCYECAEDWGIETGPYNCLD